MFIENIKSNDIFSTNQDYYDSRFSKKEEENKRKTVNKDALLYLDKCIKARKIGIELTLQVTKNDDLIVTGLVDNLSFDEVIISSQSVFLHDIKDITVIKTLIL